MGDVAQILKDTQAPSTSDPSKAMKMSGISKDVMSLLGGKQNPKTAALPPIMPTLVKEPKKHVTEETEEGTMGDSGKEVKVKVGNKWISSGKPARAWAWAPFASSSRTDGALFRHWVRANVEYTDYPYAKFDIHLDPIIYSDEEYNKHLKSEGWTKSETDKLMELARTFELRWAVIHDRWLDHFSSQGGGGDNTTMARKVEDLQERYYTVAAILAQIRITKEANAELEALSSSKQNSAAPDASEKSDQMLLETAAARSLANATPQSQPLMTDLGTGSTNKKFDAKRERERRSQLDRLWKRSKQEEQEELELRKELRSIETQLRKLKKAGGHVVAATANRMPSAASSRNASRSVTPVPGGSLIDNPDLLNQNFASNAPLPMAQNPYVQSARLAPPATGGSVGLNKTMLSRMQQVLNELKVPARPLPTKRVCDVYDSVRKDALLLVTLQKMVMQKEGTLHTKRVKLHKLGGGDGKIMDEEELLGIAPPPTPAQTPAPAAAKKVPKPSSSSTSNVKSKPAAAGSSSKAATAATTVATTKAKPSEDPSRKSEKRDTKESKEGATVKKSKSGAKRKRKPDMTGKEPAKKAPTVATAPSKGTSAPSTTPPKVAVKPAPAPAPTAPKAVPPAANAAAPAPAKATTTAAAAAAAATTPKSTPKAPAPATDTSSGSAGKKARKS